jgi:hypothetical protein
VTGKPALYENVMLLHQGPRLPAPAPASQKECESLRALLRLFQEFSRQKKEERKKGPAAPFLDAQTLQAHAMQTIVTPNYSVAMPKRTDLGKQAVW